MHFQAVFFQFDHGGAAVSHQMSHEMCEPTPNLTCFWMKLHQDVLDANAHNTTSAAVFIKFSRSYGIFPVFAETSDRSYLMFFFFPLCTINHVGRVDGINVVSKFQRLTLRLLSASPVCLQESLWAGPARSSTFFLLLPAFLPQTTKANDKMSTGRGD